MKELTSSKEYTLIIFIMRYSIVTTTDINLAEIHEEMSELVDKQLNVQKESLKKLP